MKTKNNKKKAFLGDIFLYILVLFSMGIVVISSFIVLEQTNDAWQNSSGIPTTSKQILQHQTDKFVPVWDANMTVWAIGYIIVIVITAFALRSHPVFAMLATLTLIVLGIVSVNLANSFFNFASTKEIAPIAARFTMTLFIQNNLPIFVVGLGIIFIIILYAKTRNQIPTL